MDVLNLGRESLVNARRFCSLSAHTYSSKEVPNETISTATSQTMPIVNVRRDEVKKLQKETEDMIKSEKKLYVQGMEKPLLHLLEEWHELNTSLVYSPPKMKYRSLGNRRQESFSVRISPYNVTIKKLKLQCAEGVDALLQFYCLHHIPNMTTINTRPFSIAIQVWAESRDLQSGLKVTRLIDQWGQFYGGQLEYAPTLNEFNLLLKIHAQEAADDYSGYDQSAEVLPAEKAWELFEFLVGIDLQPDIATYSHLVHALTHHAFALKYAKKHFKSEMGSDVAAIRAFFLWKQMNDLQNAEKSKHRANMVWSAHIDVLSLSATAMLKRNEHNHHLQQLLAKQSSRSHS